MSVLDLLFPPRCAACGALLLAPAPLCETCLATLIPAPNPGCVRCAEPVDRAGESCARCRAAPPPFSRIHVAFAFAGAMADAIPRFKYEDRPFLAAPLCELAYPALAEPLRGCQLLAPIPLHEARLRERGFDQALRIAEELARLGGVALAPQLLTRTRPTLQQVGSNRVARAENLRGAFSAAGQVSGVIGLVDDVVTTTATARAAAKALLDAGAQEVRVLALARAI